MKELYIDFSLGEFLSSADMEEQIIFDSKYYVNLDKPFFIGTYPIIEDLEELELIGFRGINATNYSLILEK